MYSMALGPSCFKWKMLSLSGTKALLFLQLLIALLTRSLLNICAISKDFLFVSLVTNQVSLEESVLFLTFCSAINSFNRSPQLGDICLLVQGLNKISLFCVRRCGSRCHNSVLAVQARWDLFYGGHLVLSSHPLSLLVQVPREVCVVQYGCGVTLL